MFSTYMKMNKKEKQLIKVIVYVGMPILLAWIFFFKMIAPGYVGIVVNLFGDERGADAQELTVGMHWIAPWKTIYTFPVFEQNHMWDNEWFQFQTGEGLSVNAHIGVSYHLKEDQVYKLFCKYRRGISEITDIFIKNYIRDAINKISSKMTVEQLYGMQKEQFMDDVQRSVKHDLTGIGIEIDRVYLIGRLVFPDAVIAALNAKIEATQRAQQRENELREAEAQAKKEIAKANGDATSKLVRASAEAETNRMLAQSLSPQLIAYETIKKWDGKLPQVTSDATPMIDLRGTK